MKMKFTKFKWLAATLLFVTAMVMPSSTWAQNTINPSKPLSGDGSENSPYQISTAAQLYWFAALVNGDESVCTGDVTQNISANAVLTKDIIVNTGVLNSNGTLADNYSRFETWTPIGKDPILYEGSFDGQGHTISGLYFNDSNADFVGLFGQNVGTIKNVGVVDSYFCGKERVGGVCGSNSGTITSCYNSGTASGNNWVGGVCGSNSGTITSCYNTGTVSGDYYVGGVCGDNGGIITGCNNKGSVSGDYYVGGVCGDNNGGTITSCHNTGSVSGSSDSVGGVCGDNGGTIISCYNSGSVSGYQNYTGGVCGYNSSKITSCYNTGEVRVSGNCASVGGVCGLNYGGTITSCYNSGSVSGSSDSVGGVCGSNDNGGKITGCYNTGSVSGHNQVGGVCGYNSSTITGCYNYNTGAVSGSKDVSGSSYVGGVCGYNEGGTITGCYNSGTVSGSSYVGGVCGSNVAENATATITNCYYNSEKYTGNAIGTNNGTFTNVEGKTTARFMSGEVCYLMNSGITDGTQTWHQNIDMEGATKDPYPVLDNTHGVVYQCSVCTSAYSNTEGAKGAHDYVDDGNGFLTCKACGTKSYQPATLNASNQYEISNAGQLYWFAALVNGELTGETQNASANAVLIEDITVNTGILKENGTLNNNNVSDFITWTPIGYSGSGYEGTFDGQGHTISGLYFNNSELNNVGLFGGNSGTIKNVGVVDSYFYGSVFVGGVCGGNSEGGTITGCYNTGTVSGSSYVGGVCGDNDGATITGCYNTGAVSGSVNYVGGVCGCNKTATITGGCNKTATITGCYTNNGGVCGANEEGTITGDCGEKSDNEFRDGTVCTLLNNALKKANASVRFYQGENYPKLFMNVPTHIEGVYQISNKEELYAFALVVNKNVETSAKAVLTADITVNTGVLKENGTLNNNVSGFETWTPIGFGFEYKGTFDGQGHTVSGLYFNDSSKEKVGLFGYVDSGGKISNVGVLDSYFLFRMFGGGVCGWNYGEISNCYNFSTVVETSGSGHAGGVCGYNVGGKVLNSYNNGIISGKTNTGGVCGYNQSNGEITNCYNSGTVSGKGETNQIAGVCGYNDSNCTISGCYNTGTVSGQNLGGVCGDNYGTVKNCYNTGTVDGQNVCGGVCSTNNSGTITSCYNRGVVNGTGGYVGGICGNIGSSSSTTNCYYDSNIYSGKAIGYIPGGTVDNVMGKTTAQFNSGEVCYLLNGSSPYGEWGQQIGTNDYPIIGSAYKVLRAAQDGQEGTNYWATFSNRNSNAELIDPMGGIAVYNATVSGGTLTLTKRTDNQVAKGEGVLLKANCEYVNAMNISDEVSAAETGENHLVATPDTEQTITADAGYKLYRLTYNNVSTKEGLGFYLGIVGESKNGSKLKATPGKAYLKVSTEAATKPSNAAPARGFVFPGDDETTGIGEIVIEGDAGISGSANANGRIYNLQGQQVTAPVKGLYIKNKKKVIIK